MARWRSRSLLSAVFCWSNCAVCLSTARIPRRASSTHGLRRSVQNRLSCSSAGDSCRSKVSGATAQLLEVGQQGVIALQCYRLFLDRRF